MATLADETVRENNIQSNIIISGKMQISLYGQEEWHNKIYLRKQDIQQPLQALLTSEQDRISRINC